MVLGLALGQLGECSIDEFGYSILNMSFLADAIAMTTKPHTFRFLAVTLAAVSCWLAGMWILKERRVSSPTSCTTNLIQIEGAKEQWALSLHKVRTEVPTWSDLVGRDKFLAEMPLCPGGGRYTIGDLSKPPRCSIPSHTLSVGGRPLLDSFYAVDSAEVASIAFSYIQKEGFPTNEYRISGSPELIGGEWFVFFWPNLSTKASLTNKMRTLFVVVSTNGQTLRFGSHSP